MKKNELKSLLAKHGHTQVDLAKILGVSLSCVNAKINESNTQFNLSEITCIRNHYKLSAEDVERIFFGDEVSL